jgi:kinetochor protein Mis14/NSL1
VHNQKITMAAVDPASRLTASEFRKVELQSPTDLAYLIALTQRAARQKIDVAFPPSAAPTNGEDDGMRRRVEELVSEFVEKTWEGVRMNVSCNGVDMVPESGGGAGAKEATEGNR